MGLRLGKPAKQIQKNFVENVPIIKKNVFEGHIKEFKPKQNQQINEPMSEEEFEVSNKYKTNPEATKKYFEEKNEQYKKEMEIQSQMNDHEQKFFDHTKSSEMEMMTGRRQFTDSSSKFNSNKSQYSKFNDADDEFLQGENDETDGFFKSNLDKITNNFETKSETKETKPITGTFIKPEKQRSSNYSTSNFVDRYISPDKIPGTIIGNDLFELFEKLRYLNENNIEERLLIIEEFCKTNQIQEKTLQEILKMHNSFYTIEFKEKKYGFWNISHRVKPEDVL
jgi:hypothetical protein